MNYFEMTISKSSSIVGIRRSTLACLHLEEYQFPLCRACKPGERKEASTAFSQIGNRISQIKITHELFLARKDLISFACDQHIIDIRVQLEQILKKCILRGCQPRWGWYL